MLDIENRTRGIDPDPQSQEASYHQDRDKKDDHDQDIDQSLQQQFRRVIQRPLRGYGWQTGNIEWLGQHKTINIIIKDKYGFLKTDFEVSEDLWMILV
jgi:hypothetical protein